MSLSPARLSQIETPWSLLRRAHNGSEQSVRAAREALLLRYGNAVRRYLFAVLRSQDATDELFQEFSLRLAAGNFDAASPERGHFRGYVKTTLYHLIVDFRRCAGHAQPKSLASPADVPAPAALAASDPFLDHWRQALLDRSWARLAAAERPGGSPCYTALKALSEDSSQTMDILASRLAQDLGRTISSVNVRQVIHRARRMFAEFLIDEVCDSLQTTSRDEIESELIDLNLLSYCRQALARRSADPSLRNEPAQEGPVS